MKQVGKKWVEILSGTLLLVCVLKLLLSFTSFLQIKINICPLLIFLFVEFQTVLMSLTKFSRILPFVLFSMLFTQVLAQKKRATSFDQQFSALGDNDVLAFNGSDRYYTSGIFFKYSSAKKGTKAGIKKRLTEWELGQLIYTGHKREVFVVTEIDRPVAGYLFGKYSQSTFKTEDKLLQWGVSVGTTGKLSLAEQVLNKVHPLLKINSSIWGWIWDYQVKDEIGVNVHGSYAFSVMHKDENQKFQLTPQTNVTLGTSFTYVSQSLLFQFGRLNKMYESSFWNARIENKNNVSATNKDELFVFYQPEIMYKAYDATIQGGLFRSDKGRVVWPIKPFVFSQHFGIFLSSRRYSFAIHEFLETRQAKFQFNNHAYGRVEVGYRF